MTKHITKTGIEAISRRFRFELDKAAENRDYAIQRKDSEDILYYMQQYATTKRLAERMADTLHSVDHLFKQETFLKQCGVRV
jgi:glutaredoxin 2